MRLKHPVIQKLTSWWILVIFLFAITPHQFLHDEIADHKDTVDVYHTDIEVSPHHIHCAFLQVVHAPFTTVTGTYIRQVPFDYFTFYKPAIPFYSVKTLFYFSLRGPPSLV